jgi:glutamate racemase
LEGKVYINQPIGFFDSGYGGLTVLKEVVKILPQYDYVYLGDNARAPYGSRSFETVYEYTLECVRKLFDMGCPLVILACNTASAKALRTIQQKDLPAIAPSKRVLGVLRPTTEIVGNLSSTGEIGILATSGTVISDSYPIEINKFFPEIKVFQQACPMWVPLIENMEENSDGTDFFVQKYIHQLFEKSSNIDTIVLACTHYPLLLKKIKKIVPEKIKIIEQGEIIADSLKNYLKRHPEMENRISRNAQIDFFTTETPDNFNKSASHFYGKEILAKKISVQ